MSHCLDDDENSSLPNIVFSLIINDDEYSFLWNTCTTIAVVL